MGLVRASPGRPERGLLDPVHAVLDDVRSHREVRADERREHEHEAAREKDEERCSGEADGEGGPLDVSERDEVVLDPPPRKHREGVGDGARRDRPGERDEERQAAGEHGGDDQHASIACNQAVHPEREHRDQREGREVEEIPLLDPVDRGLGGEEGDLDGEEHRDREARDGERAAGGRRAPRGEPEREERGEGDDADVEAELGDVVEEVVEEASERVAARGGRTIGTEQAERRAAPGDRAREGEERAASEDRVQRRERAQPLTQRPPLDQGEQHRRGHDRRDQRDRLRTGLEPDEADREQHDLTAPRRRLEHPDEQERRQHEQRIEGVLRHQHPRVEHRRDEHGERRGDEREPRRQQAAGEEVRGNRSERHHHRVDDLGGPVGVGDRREEPPGRRDHDRVHEAVSGRGHSAHEEVAVCSEALRELGVDDLVDHDPGGRVRPPDGDPDAGREDHDRAEPKARRHRHRPRPYGGHGSLDLQLGRDMCHRPAPG